MKVRLRASGRPGRPPFHPKLVVSAAPRRTRIVVGSANLTEAGLHHHLEAAVARYDDPALWERLAETLAVRPASDWRWTDDEGRPSEGLRELPALLGVPSLEHPIIARSRETGEVSPSCASWWRAGCASTCAGR